MPTREEKVARQSFNSSVIIAAGNLSSMVFLFIGSIVVARLLDPQAYGTYALALAIPLFLQMAVGFGMKTATNRFTAFYIARGEIARAQRMTKSAILFLLISGTIFTTFSVIFSGIMAGTFLGRPALTLYVEIASFQIFGQGLFDFLTPAFVGWKAPVQDAIWNIVQAVLKMAISIALILLGLGIDGALFGYVSSTIIAGIFGNIVLFSMKLRNPIEGQAKGSWTFSDFTSDVRMMIGYAWKAYLGTIILIFSQQPVLTIILSYIASTTVVGYYASAGAVTQSISTISAALTPAFFTAFASLEGMNSDTTIAFKHAVKYVSYFMMPIVFLLFSTSGLVVPIFYGRAYLSSTYFLELLSLSFVPYAFGYSVLIPFFNGTGNTRMFLFMNIIETIATLIPAFVLIFLFKLGINGLLLAIILSNIAPTVFGLYVAGQKLHAKVDYPNLIMTFFASVLSSAVIFVLFSFALRKLPDLASFPIEILVFTVIYLTVMPLTRTIAMEDIDRLRIASRGMRGLNKVLDVILDYESFILSCFKTK